VTWRARRRVVASGDLVAVHTSPGPELGPPAPLFVLVHGIGASPRYFDRLQAGLSRSGRAVSVDLPGFGGLPRPTQPHSIAQLAGALGRRLDELGLGPAVMVGHSMGVQVVTELALQRPDIVSHLALLGPVTDPARATAAAQGADLVRDMLRESPSANLLVLAAYLQCGPRWYAKELPAMLRYPTLEAVGRAACPVVVIRGQRDPIARSAWAARVAEAARDGRLVEVPGARHVVQHDAPEQTAAAIVAFAAHQRAGGAGHA
jgi:pimeloyl-ACP methyl ester carboxylesterase